MMYGGNGLTSWLCVLCKNKHTMSGAHYPVNPLSQLAESKDYKELENGQKATYSPPICL